MTLIHETAHFRVVVPTYPHVDRREGGHLIIHPRRRMVDRTELNPEEACELIKLTMILGQAMAEGLNERGIDVGRINYQDNGNWGVFRSDGPALHIHLYGRARSARVQRYGQALQLPGPETGFYRNCRPLDADDVAAIQARIAVVAGLPKYREF